MATHRPGRHIAGSNISGLLVAPTTYTAPLAVSPSSSVRSVLTTRADDSDWMKRNECEIRDDRGGAAFGGGGRESRMIQKVDGGFIVREDTPSDDPGPEKKQKTII
jgi:hypothetical protein